MTDEELIAVVQATVNIGYDHWVKHGTPIRREDAVALAFDVAAVLERPLGGANGTSANNG